MRYLFIIFIGFGFSGCIPRMINTAPQVQVQVLDAVTQAPIAKVLSSEREQSNEEGVIVLEKKTELGLALPVSGVFPIERRFALGKKGYLPQVCLCKTLTIRPECRSKVVKLEAANQLEESTVEMLNSLVERSKVKAYNNPNPYTLSANDDHEVVCYSLGE